MAASVPDQLRKAIVERTDMCWTQYYNFERKVDVEFHSVAIYVLKT